VQSGGKVYIACRSSVRGKNAQKEIIERSGSKNVHVRILDLASFDSIREFVRKLAKKSLFYSWTNLLNLDFWRRKRSCIF
jgi:hypothetical protein